MSSISAIQAPDVATTGPAKPVAAAAVQSATSASGTAVVSGAQPAVPSPVVYPSPVFSIDPASGKAIIDYRNANDGTITRQIPPQSVVNLYRSAGVQAAAPAAQARSSAV
jgi:hypothetical protein